MHGVQTWIITLTEKSAGGGCATCDIDAVKVRNRAEGAVLDTAVHVHVLHNLRARISDDKACRMTEPEEERHVGDDPGKSVAQPTGSQRDGTALAAPFATTRVASTSGGTRAASTACTASVKTRRPQ